MSLFALLYPSKTLSDMYLPIESLNNHELLEVIGDKNVLFKVTITFDAVKQLQAVNYSISDNAEMAILDMLQGAYWKNGFFKTGDILGEKVLYQATYEGTFLSNLFQGKGGAI